VRITAGQDIAHTIGTQSAGQFNQLSLEQPTNWLYRRGNAVGGEFVAAPGGDIASTTWWVDFSNFTQGIGALGGGNVTLKAGRDVVNVDAVVPTNAWMPYSMTTVKADGTIVQDTLAADQPLFEYGGGNLSVTAGRNISGGVYYVEKGTGTLTAGNTITGNSAETVVSAGFGIATLPTTLYLGQGSFDVKAGGDIALGPVANPFLLPQGVLNGTFDRSYFSTYAATDTVNVSSLAGSLTISDAGLTAWYSAIAYFPVGPSIGSSWLWTADPFTGLHTFGGSGFGAMAGLMPPALRATAFSGNISINGGLTLSPSPVGTVDLEAKGSVGGLQVINVFSRTDTYQTGLINLSDANPAALPGVNAPLPILSDGSDPTASFAAPFGETGATLGLASSAAIQDALHDPALLHANDPDPVRIYAVSGDITGLQMFSAKSGNFIAGRDIADVALYLQNLSPLDVSAVIAGRDISLYDATTPARQAFLLAKQQFNPTAVSSPPLAGDISIGGPGTLDVFAGRNLNTGNAPLSGGPTDGTGVGIVSIGNARNPFLPANQGAGIVAGAGIALFGAGGPSGNPNVAGFISAFLDPTTAGAEAARYLPDLGVLLGLGGASNQQVWDAFQHLPTAQRNGLALDIFYLVLRDAGRDHNDPNAVNGTRNYEVGFRAIATLFPGQAQPGDISLNEREIKTEHGGDIDLLAPGGQVTMGFNPNITQPLNQGIMTLETGDINIFANQSVTVGSSRIFTFRGGNEIIWSSTGNIAAGNASKTLVSAPPARFLINPQTGASFLDPSGLATGGGIGTLQTIKGAPPGDVDLIAPVGFIDAGDAGIRVSGNLNLAAVAVLNAANIQVQGASTGIPTVQGPPVGALTVANSTAGASQATVPTTTGSTNSNHPSIIIVEVIGYGGGPDSEAPSNDQLPRGKQRSSNYDENGMLRVLGNGTFTAQQVNELTAEERKKLTDEMRSLGVGEAR
jgi:filamentous hemagglutinin